MAGELKLVERDVVLSDGRIAIVRELSSFDEMMVEKVITTAKADELQTRMGMQLGLVRALTAYAVQSIDGRERIPIHTYSDVLKFSMGFRKRDMDKLIKAAQELNGDEDNPESQADETNSSKPDGSQSV